MNFPDEFGVKKKPIINLWSTTGKQKFVNFVVSKIDIVKFLKPILKDIYSNSDFDELDDFKITSIKQVRDRYGEDEGEPANLAKLKITVDDSALKTKDEEYGTILFVEGETYPIQAGMRLGTENFSVHLGVKGKKSFEILDDEIPIYGWRGN